MSEWISVEDRLPGQFVDVLLVCRSGHRIGYYDGKRWRDSGSDSEIYLCTHWMLLPEKPQ